MNNLYDRHGILNLTAFSSHLNREFVVLRVALVQELDQYDKAILSMSERIASYKRKLITEAATKAKIKTNGVILDDLFWKLHDADPNKATFIHQRIASMEEELNYFYGMKKMMVFFINELLEYQQGIYDKFATDQMQIVRELHNARRDAHFWHGMYDRQSQSTELFSKMVLDLATRKN